MKKNFLFFYTFIFLFVSIFSPLLSSASYNSSGAAAYLKARAGSPWVTMGLAALGQDPGPVDTYKNILSDKALDYEAPILGLVAAGKNPSTFPTTDYVAKLKTFYSGEQLGDAAILNDDVFGLLALKAAGFGNADTVVAGIKDYILSHQNSDGGWSFTVPGNSDSNTTGAAIAALAAAGVPSSDTRIAKALDYLKTAQNNDGGFTYDPKSQWGTDSDSSSTAWVMWALNALNIDQAAWAKPNGTPKTYLESTQDTGGWFHYQAGDSENSFTAVATAYAAIALAGKTLPVFAPSSPSAPLVQVAFRVEGSNSTICEGKAAGPTALDVLKNAGAQCGFAYHIKETSFGPYIDKINEDLESGSLGWLYLVNNEGPDIGAADYIVKADDSITWYYGSYLWKPTRLSLDVAETAAGSPVTATVEYLDGTAWKKLQGATVYYGVLSAATDANGQASFTPGTGYFKVYAQKADYIRSNGVQLKSGQPNSSGVNLSVDIPKGQVAGESDTSSIGFTVTPSSLDFGSVLPGGSAAKQLTISNTGSLAINLSTQVTGGEVFKNGITVNNAFWTRFSDALAAGNSKQWSVKLTIPKGSAAGKQTGQIIVWAQ